MGFTKNIVFVEGARIPFLRSGTAYDDLSTYELGHLAIKGILTRTGINPSDIDEVIMGNVVANVKTHNVARESALLAGIPESVPCYTVSQACISANRAIADAVGNILSGQAEVIIAGGVESASDAPIGYKKRMRKKLIKAQKIKSPLQGLKFLFSLRPTDFLPDPPSISEFFTKRSMGDDGEIIASKYGVTREETDAFAARSHQLAAKANKEGAFKDIVEVSLPPKFIPIKEDNGVRGDTTVEAIAKLKPVFDKKHGTFTAANSSFLTDGAAATLIMTEEKAIELQLQPKSRIIDFVFTGQSLDDELLLGPAYAIPKVLEKTGLTIDEIDFFELHEAFSGQVLAVLKALESEEFSKHKLGLKESIGSIPMEKINTEGGSLSIGHPFGATGARLLTMASNKLIKENGKYALIAACAAGAHGHAMIIEKYE